MYVVSNADGTKDCRFSAWKDTSDYGLMVLKVRIDADKNTTILTFAPSQWEALVEIVKNAEVKNGPHHLPNRPRLPAQSS